MKYLYLKLNSEETLEITGSTSIKNMSRFLQQTSKVNRVIYMKEFITNVTPLFYNLDILNTNLNLILSTPEYYQIPIDYSFISAAYIKKLDREKLFLGDLLTLWFNDLWRTECEMCNKKIYILGTGGSPLSGCGSATGFCPSCKQVVKDITPFSTYYWIAVQTLPVMDKKDLVSSVTINELLEKIGA